MKQKTPIRQAIDKLFELRDKTEDSNVIHGIDLAIAYIMPFEPVNEQQIIDAWTDGMTGEYNDEPQTGQQYFNETFEK